MPIDIRMPALSPTMEKGNLARWLKKEGDAVKAGDVIAEIETDKATMEVEAVDDGTLAKILVPEGTADVPVNRVIAVLAGEGEDVKAAASGAKTVPAAAKPAPSFETPATRAPQDEASKGPRAPQSSAPRPEEAATAAVSKDAGPKTGSRIFSSPLARRLAKEAGLDIASIQGSGPRGRVIARDIDAAKSGKTVRPAPAARPAAATAAPAMPAAPGDDKIRALYADGSYELVPHDTMRKVIAQRLTASTQTVPHFYLTVDCDIGRLLSAREQINAQAPKDKDGKPAWKLSVNDFVIKALALALTRVPEAKKSD